MVVTDQILFMLNFWGNGERFLSYGAGAGVRHKARRVLWWKVLAAENPSRTQIPINYSIFWTSSKRVKDTFYLFGVTDLQLRPEGTSLSPTRRPWMSGGLPQSWCKLPIPSTSFKKKKIKKLKENPKPNPKSKCLSILHHSLQILSHISNGFINIPSSPQRLFSPRTWRKRTET